MAPYEAFFVLIAEEIFCLPLSYGETFYLSQFFFSGSELSFPEVGVPFGGVRRE